MGKRPQEDDSPKGSSNLTANGVISELSLIIVHRLSEKLPEKKKEKKKKTRTFNKYLSRASSSNSNRIHFKGT
jgi:hypothetical protein